MAVAKWLRPLGAAKRLAAGMKGVTGIDHGWGYKDGRRKKRLCIRFHVERKRDPVELTAREMLPTTHMGIPCDVVQGSYGLHLSPRERIEPLVPGVSVGNLDRGSTGTLGALVKDRLSGRVMLLSNWHVLCGGTGATAGDVICQPGPEHAGSIAARRVGLLARWLRLDQGLDAALATLDEGADIDAAVFKLNFDIAGTAPPVNGMRLVKMGAVSEDTSAVVDGIDGTYRMNYSLFGDQVRWMDGFRLVREEGEGPDEVSLAGDSGAAWINPATREAVGLHFGGEDGLGPLAEYAIAHPVGRVLELLDASLPP